MQITTTPHVNPSGTLKGEFYPRTRLAGTWSLDAHAPYQGLTTAYPTLAQAIAVARRVTASGSPAAAIVQAHDGYSLQSVNFSTTERGYDSSTFKLDPQTVDLLTRGGSYRSPLPQTPIVALVDAPYGVARLHTEPGPNGRWSLAFTSELQRMMEVGNDYAFSTRGKASTPVRSAFEDLI